MKSRLFTEEQIIGILKQAQANLDWNVLDRQHLYVALSWIRISANCHKL